MKSGPATSPQKDPLDLGVRVLHVLLGGTVLLGSGGMSLLLGTIVLLNLPRPSPGTSLLTVAVLGGVSVLFALLALWGASLARRGLRGYRLIDRAPREPNSAWVFVSAMGGSALWCLITEGYPGWVGGGFSVAVWYFLAQGLWILPAVAWHELGHAATAAWLGLPWTSLRVGPLEVFPSGQTPRVRWHSEGMASALGLTRFDSVKAVDSPTRFAWVVLGGPAANVLGALMHGAWAWALGSPSPSEAQGLAALVWAGAMHHATLALLNLLPRRFESGRPSDGALWLMMRRLRRGSEGQRLLARLQAEAATRRPREWSSTVEPLRTASAAPGESPEVAALLSLFALALLLDRGEVDAARALLEALEPKYASLHAEVRVELLLQDALMRALCDADAPRARARLEAVGARPTSPLYPRLAEAAVLLCEGRTREAHAALSQWEEALAHGRQVEWTLGNLWALERLRAALALAQDNTVAETNEPDQGVHSR